MKWRCVARTLSPPVAGGDVVFPNQLLISIDIARAPDGNRAELSFEERIPPWLGHPGRDREIDEPSIQS